MNDACNRSHAWPVLLLVSVATACNASGRDDSLSTGFGDAPVGDSTSDTGAAQDDSSGPTDPILDVGSPDDPAPECASISQTTMIESLPSDIVMVAVGEHGSVLDFRNEITAMLEFIRAEGVEDGHAVFVVDGEPMPDERLFPGCQGWVCCWGVGECPADDLASFLPHAVVDASIDATQPLAAVIATAGQWRDTLRPEARKHVWFIAPDNRDEVMDADAFATAFEALGPSYDGFTAHAFIGGDASQIDASGGTLGDLVSATGGTYHDHSLGNYWAPDFYSAVLEGINKTALLCSYDIPAPPEGLTFDKQKVNVDYDEGNGLETIGYVSSLAECAQSGPGWYYDDEAAPTEILMCPSSCDRFKSAQNATIDIRFGCETIPAG